MQLGYVLYNSGSKTLPTESDIVMSDIDFGELLREKRKELNITQEELAERAGIGLQTIGRIERGAVQPKLGQVRRIFSVLGLNLDAIDEKGDERLTAWECLNRIELYVGELRKILGK